MEKKEIFPCNLLICKGQKNYFDMAKKKGLAINALRGASAWHFPLSEIVNPAQGRMKNNNNRRQAQ